MSGESAFSFNSVKALTEQKIVDKRQTMTSTMNVKQLLEQTDKELTVSDDKAEQIVLAGGPVSWASSLKLAPGVMVTTSKDILTAIANDEGPEDVLIALGYAGWTAGQPKKFCLTRLCTRNGKQQ